MTLLPTLTYSFIEYFKNIDTKNKTLLELGSGNSTIYWQNFFSKIYSYDNNLEYQQTFHDKIDTKVVELLHFDKDIFTNKTFIAHVQAADYIIIDNNPKFIGRDLFCKFTLKNMNEDCFIILDNGDWNPKAYLYLFDNMFCRDFPGLNTANEDTLTSIFFGRRPNSPERKTLFFHKYSSIFNQRVE